MPFEEPPDVVAEWRKIYTDGNDASHFAQIGAFICYFSTVEMYITGLLASVIGMHDVERFEFVAKGMDVRAKVERLFSADPKYVTIGPNLKARLERFKAVCGGIRNQISHSSPYPKDGFIHFLTLGGRHDDETAPKVLIDDLTRETLWMFLLAEDLHSVPCSTPHMWLPILEIASPRSNLPKADRPPPLMRVPRAKPRKPSQRPRTK